MHNALLFVHSWFRWVVVAAVVVVVVRSLRGTVLGAPWTPRDSKALSAAAHILTAQFVIGVVLYIVSPYVRGLLGDMGATMQDRTSRFFAVEHATVMLLAVGAAHMGKAIAKKGATDKAKHSRALMFFLLVVALVGYGIPWARPWLRY